MKKIGFLFLRLVSTVFLCAIFFNYTARGGFDLEFPTAGRNFLQKERGIVYETPQFFVTPAWRTIDILGPNLRETRSFRLPDEDETQSIQRWESQRQKIQEEDGKLFKALTSASGLEPFCLIENWVALEKETLKPAALFQFLISGTAFYFTQNPALESINSEELKKMQNAQEVKFQDVLDKKWEISFIRPARGKNQNVNISEALQCLVTQYLDPFFYHEIYRFGKEDSKLVLTKLVAYPQSLQEADLYKACRFLPTQIQKIKRDGYHLSVSCTSWEEKEDILNMVQSNPDLGITIQIDLQEWVLDLTKLKIL